VPVDLVRKRIKHLHLTVYPAGRVRVSAPHRTSDDEVRSFVTSRIGWVRRKQQLFAAQERDTPRQLVTGETHHVAGHPYRLEVVERDGPPSIALRDDETIVLAVRRGSDTAARGLVLDRWLRALQDVETARLVAQWEPVIGVRVARVTQRRMKSRWGTCNIARRVICLNTELAKKPPASLEYVVVHEMVHLLRRRHDDRFHAHMDRFMPDWRLRRAALNHRMSGTLAGPAGNEAASPR
jgi:predicted metal-dependent hydrolase